jgi:hypothetical protein
VATDSDRQAGELTDVEITQAMVEAGVDAFLRHASYDEFSLYSLEQTVRAVLLAGLGCLQSDE